jgi:hypothetical protein
MTSTDIKKTARRVLESLTAMPFRINGPRRRTIRRY